jgi:tetratricopeptide (TPR) repeat protein
MSRRRSRSAGSVEWLACCGLAIASVPISATENAAVAIPHPDPVFASRCGTLDNAYGPFDYTNPKDVAERLPIVEQFHFNRNVESLISGQTSELLGADLDYTLRAFPNHHRALYAMVRYTLRHKGERVPPGAHYPGECYLLRAVRFKPDDASVRGIYGVYLSAAGRSDEALAQYEMAAEFAPTNAEAHYNLGLLYRKLHRLDEALEHAKIAYRLGYPLQGLKNQLKRDGVWKADSDGEATASSPPPGVE